MRAYKLIVKPGTSQEIAAIGNYIRLKSADVSVFIESPDKAEAAILDTGDSMRLSGFVRIRVSHESAVEQAITLYIGQDTRLDSSRVAGVVSVINGELSRVKSGSAFSSTVGRSAVVGEYSRCQLWNPAGSGKNIILTKADCLSLTSGFVAYLVKATAAAVTLGQVPPSKLIGGPIGVGEVRVEGGTSQLAATSQQFQMTVASAVNTLTTLSFAEPIVIPPGLGVTIEIGSTNIHLAVSLQWYEDSL